jgi:hypothetical protein
VQTVGALALEVAAAAFGDLSALAIVRPRRTAGCTASAIGSGTSLAKHGTVREEPTITDWSNADK